MDSIAYLAFQPRLACRYYRRYYPTGRDRPRSGRLLILCVETRRNRRNTDSSMKVT